MIFCFVLVEVLFNLVMEPISIRAIFRAKNQQVNRPTFSAHFFDDLYCSTLNEDCLDKSAFKVMPVQLIEDFTFWYSQLNATCDASMIFSANDDTEFVSKTGIPNSIYWLKYSRILENSLLESSKIQYPCCKSVTRAGSLNCTANSIESFVQQFSQLLPGSTQYDSEPPVCNTEKLALEDILPMFYQVCINFVAGLLPYYYVVLKYWETMGFGGFNWVIDRTTEFVKFISGS